MNDVIVIGGGVIGLSIAYELAGQGAGVAVLDQADFGREASWAGAGILPPGNLDRAVEPEARLRAYSHSLWNAWAGTLAQETGIETGYLRCGGLEIRVGPAVEELNDEIEHWQQEGIDVEELSPEVARDLEPRLSSSIVAAFRLPQLGQVRNPRLLKSLVAACAARGVELRAGTPATGFDTREMRVDAVRTPSGVLRAGRFCVAGGAWTRAVMASLGSEAAVEPIRGQIVLLSHAPRLFSHVIQHGSRYLVPRADGRVLVGSTEERAGYSKENTASAVGELLAFGVSVIPDLAAARLERAWSGLRPGSADGLPYLGPVDGYENLFIAAGHFRSGLQMSPGTARLLRQAILDQETDISLKAYSLDRRRAGVARRV